MVSPQERLSRQQVKCWLWRGSSTKLAQALPRPTFETISITTSPQGQWSRGQRSERLGKTESSQATKSSPTKVFQEFSLGIP